MIRRGVPGDEEDLADVHITSWQVAYADIFPKGFLEDLDRVRRRDWWRDFLARDEWVAVATTDRVVGFCTANLSRDDDTWGEIPSIYVHPDRWGEGHGRLLIRAGEDRLRWLGVRRAMLWVLEANHRARSFYEREGWTLGGPIRLEDIGGYQVGEVRYEIDL